MFEQTKKPDPAILVIFGATGDLTHRKLMPAICNLIRKGIFPEHFAIVAVARRDKSNEEYRWDVRQSVKKYNRQFNENSWNKLSSHLYYYRKDFDKEDSYASLKDFLAELDKKHSTKGNRIFYLSTLPNHFSPIVNNLKKYKFISRRQKKVNRIIIEKPFGDDLKSARHLNKKLSELFREDEIFRIDHYLGKETVQNLFALRFANRLFSSVWNTQNIDNIQISVTENLGVGTRGGYYDNYGALKDMVQNHLLQILSIVAMEPPISFDTQEIKDEKVRVLKSIRSMSTEQIKENVVFGQYKRGETGVDYTDESGVASDSRTETYVAMRLKINNERWVNTPFYLRTGKSLKRKASEVVIYFKDTEFKVFSEGQKQNVLVIRLQPDEGIYFRFNAKKPGNDFKMQEVSMDFCHDCLFGINTPEAYEKLLMDIFKGDTTLFTRWDEVENSWKIIDPISEYWQNSGRAPEKYKKGTWGPEASNILVSKEKHRWREPL
ncbi:glucose-6-phosphate dehydrogenase [Candidatus Woesearchaeota archaeon]|nr:glucose-6-phosphate dehydrogenase [Candidatus Woesearchaeota archaeon]